VFDLEQRLSRMGLDLVTGAPTAQKSRLIGGGRVPRQDLINFCFHLEQLASAGVPIVEGLIDLRESTENLRFREIVGGLVETIEGGKSLSQALADYPEVFSKVVVSLVRSGEQTGKLSDVLKSLADTLKWEDELAAQTKKIMMYPAFVGSVVLLVTFFLMIYLVPQMSASSGHGPGDPAADAHPDPRLELLRRLLVGRQSRAVRALVRRQGGRQVESDIAYSIDDLKLRVPFIGPILRKIILSRFASSFAMMYSSGITVLDAIRSSRRSSATAARETRCAPPASRSPRARALPPAFTDVGLFPALVIRMLRSVRIPAHSTAHCSTSAISTTARCARASARCRR
jgi:type IV pilus assembly protein PilC